MVPFCSIQEDGLMAIGMLYCNEQESQNSLSERIMTCHHFSFHPMMIFPENNLIPDLLYTD